MSDQGRVFVITHELTHVLKGRNPNIYDRQFLSSSAKGEYDVKGIINSYPLCSGFSCSDRLVTTVNEDFAEMAGNYVADRDPYDQGEYPTGYTGSINFQSEYPKHYNFARDVLFEGTTF